MAAMLRSVERGVLLLLLLGLRGQAERQANGWLAEAPPLYTERTEDAGTAKHAREVKSKV
jgi:hypothetical protein